MGVQALLLMIKKSTCSPPNRRRAGPASWGEPLAGGGDWELRPWPGCRATDSGQAGLSQPVIDLDRPLSTAVKSPPPGSASFPAPRPCPRLPGSSGCLSCLGASPALLGQLLMLRVQQAAVSGTSSRGVGAGPCWPSSRPPAPWSLPTLPASPCLPPSPPPHPRLDPGLGFGPTLRLTSPSYYPMMSAYRATETSWHIQRRASVLRKGGNSLGR